MTDGLYLLHFEPPYQHARHYLGWAKDIDRRIVEHVQKKERGSPLVRAALDAGSLVLAVRRWPGADRYEERRLKNQGGLSRHCPLCRESGDYHR